MPGRSATIHSTMGLEQGNLRATQFKFKFKFNRYFRRISRPHWPVMDPGTQSFAVDAHNRGVNINAGNLPNATGLANARTSALPLNRVESSACLAVSIHPGSDCHA